MFREYKFEIITAAIGLAISFGIALALTGDFGEALARTNRGR